MDHEALRDTIFVSLDNGLWSNPALYAALASLASAATAIFAYINSINLEKRTRRQGIYSRWADLAPMRRVFWQKLEYGYDIWLQEIKWSQKSEEERPPRQLSELLEKVGLPLPSTTKILDNSLASSILKCGDREKQWIMNFSNRVFHEKSGSGSIVVKSGLAIPASAQWKELDDARAALFHTLEGWARIEDEKFLTEHFCEYYHLVYMLCWLEIALGRHLGKSWALSHKFVKLAELITTSRLSGRINS